MRGKSCSSCKGHNKKCKSASAPVKAPKATKAKHSKSKASVASPNLHRGRIMYKF